MTCTSPAFLALRNEACTEAALRDEHRANLMPARDLLDAATQELLLLAAEMERPSRRGVERRRCVSIALAADLMRRKEADKIGGGA